MSYCILDIDLDYFNLMDSPVAALHELLEWAQRPISIVVERHSQVLRAWHLEMDSRGLPEPTHILHVDEHHDMMNERSNVNIANVMVHAMQLWSACRVHWLVTEAIDSPGMWLDETTWRCLRQRFSTGSVRPPRWPKPEIVSVCISPEFVEEPLRDQLMAAIWKNYKGKMPNHALQRTGKKPPAFER